MNYGEDTTASPRNSVLRGDSVVEENRPQTAAPEDETLDVPKRKSGTFWRRKSSLNMSGYSTVNGKEDQPQNADSDGTWTGAAVGGDTGGGLTTMTNGRHEGEEDATMEDLGTEKPLPEIVKPLSPRSFSPPPQLPMFVGGGEGLGGEDLFKDIH